MKKLLFISLICTLISSCNDNLEEITWHSNENKIASRSITTEVSPMFDWDDTTHISLYNISRPVILPWYSGAEASIPSFILDSYKESDGWKLVYNTCSPSLLMQDGKYYLIFYNIFSGRLRGYVYNKNDVTSGDITFWQLTFDNRTTLLNDLTPNTTPGTIPVDEHIISVSNLSVNPTKALSEGWNAFEIDLLTYDPNMSNKNISMTISAYDVDRSEIVLQGNINLESSGTMLTTTTIPSTTSYNPLTKAISLLGDSAKAKINDMFAHNNESATSKSLLGMAVGAIIKAGGNFLVNKFFGRSSSQTIKSESEIKISSNGTFNVKGNMTSQQQSNISPLSRLMLPGSTPTPEDIFMPSYDEPLGVWYLEQAPEVRHNAITWFFTTEPLGTSDEYIGHRGTKDFYTLDQSSIHVTLNPAVLPYIDKYEVSAKLLEVRKTAHKPSKTAQAPIMVDGIGQGSVSYCPISFDSEFFPLRIRCWSDSQIRTRSQQIMYKSPPMG